MLLLVCTQLAPGILDAPVGASVTLVQMELVGAKLLLAWNEALATMVRVMACIWFYNNNLCTPISVHRRCRDGVGIMSNLAL